MKNIFIIFFATFLTNIFAQNTKKELIDSNFRIEIQLHYQIPSFSYFNDKIDNGIFEQSIDYEGKTFNIQGGFKDFKADGLWVALDSSGISRLIGLFRSDTLVFLHLNDSLGRPAHHFTYRNNEIINQEWYNNGKLDQYDEHSDTGRIIVSFHENMKHRLTFFVNKKGITYKKRVYDNNGVFIKETENVNE